MPDFRCHLLDERGDVVFPAELSADSLDAAIRHAFGILQSNNEASTSRHVSAVEIWSGADRLFPPTRNVLRFDSRRR